MYLSQNEALRVLNELFPESEGWIVCDTMSRIKNGTKVTMDTMFEGGNQYSLDIEPRIELTDCYIANSEGAVTVLTEGMCFKNPVNAWLRVTRNSENVVHTYEYCQVMNYRGNGVFNTLFIRDGKLTSEPRTTNWFKGLEKITLEEFKANLP